jgi:hypothetical protein
MVAKSPVMSPDVCVGVIHKLGFGGNNVVTTTEVMLGGNDRVRAYLTPKAPSATALVVAVPTLDAAMLPAVSPPASSDSLCGACDTARLPVPLLNAVEAQKTSAVRVCSVNCSTPKLLTEKGSSPLFRTFAEEQ